MTEDKLMPDKEQYIVFYDGDCGFCNHWVHWILLRDKKDQFLFSALQSDFGQQFLQERQLPDLVFDTLYLWKPQHYYLTKYQAIIKIASLIGGSYALAEVGKVLPSPIGNLVYDIISKHRKKLWANQCFVPTPEQRKKFIE